MRKILACLLVCLFVFGSFALSVQAAEPKVNNVILMIGDGMGPNHLNLAKQERGISLFMENECDYFGYSMTRSHSNPVTDSAAGGTALACGVRTDNRCIAVYPADHMGLFSVPRTLAEAAKLAGKKAGVVTSDSNDGATPSTFTAHTSDRGNSKDICTQQAKSDFDLIWARKSDSFDVDLAQANGFTVVTTRSEMEALDPDTRSFGQFEDQIWKTAVSEGCSAPTLSQMTAKAITQLDNTEGFFLMVEGAHIDKWSHTSNKPDNYDTKVANAAEAVEEFDHAIETAVNFARADGHTLVVITADHETGGITLKDGKYTYTKDEHSGVDVPLIVFGSDEIVGNDEHIENRQVAQRIGKLMGFSPKEFPVKDSGKLTDFFARLMAWLRDFFGNLFVK